MSEVVDEQQINALTEAVQQGLERSIDVVKEPAVASGTVSATATATTLEMVPSKPTTAAAAPVKQPAAEHSGGQRVCLTICGCLIVAAVFFFIGFYVFIYCLSKALQNG